MANDLGSRPEGRQRTNTSSSQQTAKTAEYNRVRSIYDDHVISAMCLPSPEEVQLAKSELVEYICSQQNEPSSNPKTQRQHDRAAGFDFSDALEQLVRSRDTEYRGVIMKDIDVLFSSYKGHQVNDITRHSVIPRRYNEEAKCPSTAMDINERDTMISAEKMYSHRALPPPPIAAPVARSVPHPAFKVDIFDEPRDGLRNNRYAPQERLSHLRIEEQYSRWSAGSDDSMFSDTTTTTRSSLTSSINFAFPTTEHSSHPVRQSGLPELVSQAAPSSLPVGHQFSHVPFALYAAQLEASRLRTAQPASQQRERPASIAPWNFLQRDFSLNEPHPSLEYTNSPMHMPWPGSINHNSNAPSLTSRATTPQNPDIKSTDDCLDSNKAARPQYNLISDKNYNGPQTFYNDDDSNNNSNSSNINLSDGEKPTSSYTSPITTLPITSYVSPPPPPLPRSVVNRLRHASMASTGSNSSLGKLGGGTTHPIGSKQTDTSTISKSPVAPSLSVTTTEKVLKKHPCKDSNYWGFCKGAWAVRADVTKGIVVRTEPLGYYNVKQVWKCASCHFQGETFTAPHPTKKNKTVTVVDPRIHISISGIRYRWIFFAKSHVKKQNGSTGMAVDEEYSYCCVICAAEGIQSAVYHGTEALMNHIALGHIRDMSESTREMVNCVMGRVAGPSEAFDINVPVFTVPESLGGSARWGNRLMKG